MTMRRAYEINGEWLVTVEVASHEQYENGPFDFGSSSDGSLAKVIASFEVICDMIPEPYRSGARCEISSVGSHYAHISVEYVRPATDEEIAVAQSHRDMQKANERNRDIAALAALKAKLGA